MNLHTWYRPKLNIADVDGDQPDPNTSNNVATAETLVVQMCTFCPVMVKELEIQRLWVGESAHLHAECIIDLP